MRLGGEIGPVLGLPVWCLSDGYAHARGEHRCP